ncbi:SNW domain-containing protein 1-like [Trifolium pratense]|uniref:SNW domain-containing protein 1-like n=1 Tax=Trifolium pratense TaxID=57577 RepID=A0A2K3LRP3_TRIPR|nr:SNW domain-containing protein 1-like [Trifolium pratense]
MNHSLLIDDGDIRVDYEQREKNYPERDERLQREKIREERRKKRERERRLEAKDAVMRKKSKITRDKDRDISEKVALGLASTKQGTEVMYDERLFNQDKGISSGFATNDQYNVYERGLFNAQPTLSTLYRPKKDLDNEAYRGADEQLEKIMKTDRFKPDKGFAGASERAGPRDRPVEFEREEADPFGLDQCLIEVKKGKKAINNVGVGASGIMRASAINFYV